MGPSFSYQGQDQFVIEASGRQRNGFFLDSGASNGVRGNNTVVLESLYDWQGICVEPNAALYAELKENRSCVCLDCCLYTNDGPVEFFEAGQVYGGIVSEYEPAHLEFARAFAAGEAARQRPKALLAPVTKQARTIRSILRDHGAPSVIDYWSLDTEGSELALLRSFPFDEFRIRYLTVEHNHSPVRGHIRAFLAAKGFRHARSLGIDDAYIWVGRDGAPAWRSRAWPARH